MGRPKMNKPKQTKKGQRGRPRKNNSKHPSHELDNDVGHEVENLLEEQDSNISEEQDESDGGQDKANTTIGSKSSGSSKPPPGNPISNFTMQSWPSCVRNFLLTGEKAQKGYTPNACFVKTSVFSLDQNKLSQLFNSLFKSSLRRMANVHIVTLGVRCNTSVFERPHFREVK